jgi:hypothetical protein
MRTVGTVFAFLVSCGYGFAQESAPPPVALEQMTTLLANQDFAEVPEVEGLIRKRGIAFDLDRQQLGKILEAALKGNRNPDEVAALILTSLSVCQQCRARAIGPMEKEELKTLIKWGFLPVSILEEARVRGVKDIEVTKATADELRAAGAKDDLINFLLPDDIMPTIPPEGDYKIVPLRRAVTYNLAAPQGLLWITVDLPAKSRSEFVFKHNALFARAIQGESPTVDLDYSSFNKPTPRDTEFIDKKSNLDPPNKSGLLSRSKQVEPLVEYLPADADPDRRNAFRIQFTNKENGPQRYSFRLTWQAGATPKTPGTPPKP